MCHVTRGRDCRGGKGQGTRREGNDSLAAINAVQQQHVSSRSFSYFSHLITKSVASVAADAAPDFHCHCPCPGQPPTTPAATAAASCANRPSALNEIRFTESASEREQTKREKQTVRASRGVEERRKG